MKQEELLKRCAAIDQEAQKRKEELYRAYAYANNTVKVGDIISDGVSCIRVKTMGVYVNFYGSAQMRYFGPELTKVGTPRKDGRESWVYQENIKTIKE